MSKANKSQALYAVSTNHILNKMWFGRLLAVDVTWCPMVSGLLSFAAFSGCFGDNDNSGVDINLCSCVLFILIAALTQCCFLFVSLL